MSRLGLALATVLFVPGSLWIAWSIWAATRALGLHVEDLHRAVLLGVHLMWILSPLVGIALGDAYDVSRLLVYPISRRTLLSGLLGSTVLDLPVLLMVPTLAVVAFAVPGPPAAGGVAVLAVALFFTHAVALNQAIGVATAGAAQSRRLRDLVIVLAPLVLVVMLFALQVAGRRGMRFDIEQFLNSPAWQAAAWLPPGFASRAIEAAHRGDWMQSAGLLAGLAALAAVSVMALSWTLRRTYEGAGVAGGRMVRPGRRSGWRVRPVLGSLLPDPIGAIVGKELRVAVRDPFFKSRVLNLVYLLALVYFPIVAFRPPADFFVFALAPAAAILLFGQMPILGNLFGSDGEASSLLFQSPCRRRDILLGKNLALLTILFPLNAALMAALAALTGQVQALPGVLFSVALGFVVMAGVGNFLSVWFPLRVVTQQGRLQQHSFARGCGYALVQLGAVTAGAFLLLPPLGAVVWSPDAWRVPAAAAATAYALALYTLALGQAEQHLRRHEERIVRALTTS